MQCIIPMLTGNVLSNAHRQCIIPMFTGNVLYYPVLTGNAFPMLTGNACPMQHVDMCVWCCIICTDIYMYMYFIFFTYCTYTSVGRCKMQLSNYGDMYILFHRRCCIYMYIYTCTCTCTYMHKVFHWTCIYYICTCMLP